MNTNPLLVELLVEELPPKALKKLGEAFASLLSDGLKAQGLAAADAAVTAPSAAARPRDLRPSANSAANASPSFFSALGGSSSTKSSTSRFLFALIAQASPGRPKRPDPPWGDHAEGV